MDDNKELNLDQLGEVNGGTGIQEFPSKLNINLRQLNTNKAAGQTEPASLDPMEGVNVNTDAVECPKCHKMKLSHHVCKFCGFYDGTDVLKLEEKENQDKKEA